MAGFGFTVITTFCVVPAQLEVGVTSNDTDPTAAEVLVSAEAPVNVAERLPIPVFPTAKPTTVEVIAPVILVTSQLKVLAGFAVNNKVVALPLQML